MTDATQPSGEANGGRDPWAPPENGPSLDKDRAPGAGQPSGPQPPSVHDQATVTSMPTDGFAAPGYPPPGYPASGAPTAATPVGGPAPVGGPGPGVPLPPMAPTGPGGYGYPSYPPGYGWPGMPAPPQNGMGTAAMVLGILSCCLFCLYGVLSLALGILAVVLGIKGRKRVQRGEATNHSQAQAGLITGIIGIVLGLIVVAVMVIGIVLAINSDEPDSDPYYDGAAHAVSTSVVTTR
ncbi:DUF4190 domain-containing protein [Streptomyces sp. NPDC002838]|uniref:DUF4190 domain-containing protein n=1 Tax=Streptomyces sp. NPDC002838 TaxID=3154436 RepID=UPI0033325660